MNQLERANDFNQVLKAALRGTQSKLWTSLPGIINSFDPERLTATVVPAIKMTRVERDGTEKQVVMGLLLDVPIVFPRGGNCTLTFPIKQGDEVLVVFASRCIDAWWQSGGVQAQAEFRMHDLSDGFAIPGPFSQATKIAGLSADSVQLRTDDGQAAIEINPTTHGIKARTVGDLSAKAAGAIQLDAPTIVITGNIELNGSLTATGDLVGAGISLDGHVHTGVRSGGDSTGRPAQ